jgi:hypothetical protein
MNGQTKNVYDAEESVAHEIDFDDDLAVDAVLPFVRDVLSYFGFSTLPRVSFDVADDDWRAGWFDPDGIHLHERLVGRWVVLHELAHWLRPHVDGHGPQFCAVLVSLVRADLGSEVADVLLDAYARFGVDVDRTWLLEPAALIRRKAS